MTSSPRAFHPDDAPEAPGQSFIAWRYCAEATQCGIAKKLGSAYATLMAISFHANKQRHAWPSEQKLADELGCEKRQVRRDVAHLVAVGAIVVAPFINDKGKREGQRKMFIIMPLQAVKLEQTAPTVKRQPVNIDRLSTGQHAPLQPVNIDQELPPTPLSLLNSPSEQSSEMQSGEENRDDGDEPPRHLTPIQQLIEAVRLQLRWDTVPKSLYGKWARQAKAALSDYPLDDLLAALPWFFSDGYWRENDEYFEISKIHNKMESWRKRGRPQTNVTPPRTVKAEQPRPNPDRAMRQRADRVIAVRSYPVTAEQEAAIERSRRAREEAEHVQ